VENKVKKNDVIIPIPSWDDSLEKGKVISVWNLLNGDQGFNVLFDGEEERGPFHTTDIGKIIRLLTPLEKAML
jgi:hypothetical protein